MVCSRSNIPLRMPRYVENIPSEKLHDDCKNNLKMTQSTCEYDNCTIGVSMPLPWKSMILESYICDSDLETCPSARKQCFAKTENVFMF